MQYLTIALCNISITLSAIIGIIRYKQLDISLKILVLLLIISSISDLSCFMAIILEKFSFRSTIFHFYNIIQGIFLTIYFLTNIKPNYNKIHLILIVLFWVSAGVLNFIFFQPLGTLNSNMLMLESFIFITLSLYYMYITMKNDRIGNIFRHTHFILSFILIVYWSTTFFFWACLKILYSNHWKYIMNFMYFESVIEILVFLSISATLFYYSKQNKMHEI